MLMPTPLGVFRKRPMLDSFLLTLPLFEGFSELSSSDSNGCDLCVESDCLRSMGSTEDVE